MTAYHTNNVLASLMLPMIVEKLIIRQFNFHLNKSYTS